MKRKRYPKIRRIYNGEVLDLMDTKDFWELVEYGYGEDFADKMVESIHSGYSWQYKEILYETNRSSV
jgi:hypothetical protein